VNVAFDGARQITFPRDLTFTLQAGEINDRPSYANNDGYGLTWEVDSCDTISVSGCEHVQLALIVNYVLLPDPHNGRPAHQAVVATDQGSGVNQLYYDPEYENWEMANSMSYVFVYGGNVNDLTPFTVKDWHCLGDGLGGSWQVSPTLLSFFFSS